MEGTTAEVNDHENNEILNKSFSMQNPQELVEFAIICSFIENFGPDTGITLTFKQLSDLFLEDKSIPKNWETLHIKLLNKAHRRALPNNWISVLQRFVSSQSNTNLSLLSISDQLLPETNRDQSQIYLNLDLQSRILIFLELLEYQFDKNDSFKSRSNKEWNLVSKRNPLGSDVWGKLYWLLTDREFNILLYREDCEETTLTLVASDPSCMLELAESLEAQCTVATKLSDICQKSSKLEAELYEECKMPILVQNGVEIKSPKLRIKLAEPKNKHEPLSKMDSETVIKEDAISIEQNIELKQDCLMDEPKTIKIDDSILDNKADEKESKQKKKSKKKKMDVVNTTDENLVDNSFELRRSGRTRKPVQFLQLEQLESAPRPRKKIKEPEPPKKSRELKKQKAIRSKKSKDGDFSSSEFDEILDEIFNQSHSDNSLTDKEATKWDDRPESDFDPEAMDENSDAASLDLGRNLARQRKRQKAEIPEEDKPCQFCGLSDRPEWLLLCDKCDLGHHAMCICPPLYVIPSGQWFCPKCNHLDLIINLKEKANEMAKKHKEFSNRCKMEERLKYINISMSNIISNTDRQTSRDVNVNYIDDEENDERRYSDSAEENVYSSEEDDRPRRFPRRTGAMKSKRSCKEDYANSENSDRPPRKSSRSHRANRRYSSSESEIKEEVIIPRTKRKAAVKAAESNYNVKNMFKDLDDALSGLDSEDIEKSEDEDEENALDKEDENSYENKVGKIDEEDDLGPDGRPRLLSSKSRISPKQKPPVLKILLNKKKKKGAESDSDFNPSDEQDEDFSEENQDDSDYGSSRKRKRDKMYQEEEEDGDNFSEQSSDASWKRSFKKKKGRKSSFSSGKRQIKRTRRKPRKPKFSASENEEDDFYEESESNNLILGRESRRKRRVLYCEDEDDDGEEHADKVNAETSEDEANKLESLKMNEPCAFVKKLEDDEEAAVSDEGDELMGVVPRDRLKPTSILDLENEDASSSPQFEGSEPVLQVDED